MKHLVFHLRRTRIRIHPLTLPCLAALFIADSSVYTVLVLLAAVLHEAGHLTALLLCGIIPDAVEICPFGAVIEAGTASLPTARELFVLLAGIGVNTLLAAICLPAGYVTRMLPLLFFGAANAVLAAVNLCPVHTLDGGRACDAILFACLPPDRAQPLSDVISDLALLLLSVLSVRLFAVSACNFSLLIFCIALFISLCG